MRSRPGWDEWEVYFRIVYAAEVCHHDSSVATYREQTVEIFMVGPKGVFENGNIGAITRRAPPDLEVSAVLPNRGDPKPPREPKTPLVVEFLLKATEWQALLESGGAINQADIAGKEEIARAKVTRVNTRTSFHP